jgi:hypothetical protein
MEAAKALSCSPAALDLFTWLSYRCFVSKGANEYRCSAKAALRVPGVLPARSRRSTEGRNSGGQVELIMIKSDAQRERTEAQVEGFRQAIAKVDQKMTGTEPQLFDAVTK